MSFSAGVEGAVVERLLVQAERLTPVAELARAVGLLQEPARALLVGAPLNVGEGALERLVLRVERDGEPHAAGRLEPALAPEGGHAGLEEALGLRACARRARGGAG